MTPWPVYVRYRGQSGSKRSPDERSDILGFQFPAYRYAHAGYWLCADPLDVPRIDADSHGENRPDGSKP